MKTALCTGAAGFVGRHVCPLLEREGYEVIGCDDSDEIRLPLTGRWLYRNSVEEMLFRETSFNRFDLIIHLAANIEDVSVRMAGELRQYQDIVLDYRMAEYVLAYPPRECFVVPSSCAVDNPADPYGYVKQTGERFWMELHKARIPTVILRPFSGYGEDQSELYPFPAILKRALERQDPLIVWGSGKQQRDWIHVDDLARAFLWGIHSAPRGVPIEIGTGLGTSLHDLARLIAQEVGYTPSIRGDESKPASKYKRIADTSVADRHGFRFEVSLCEGIRRAVAARTSRAITA